MARITTPMLDHPLRLAEGQLSIPVVPLARGPHQGDGQRALVPFVAGGAIVAQDDACLQYRGQPLPIDSLLGIALREDGVVGLVADGPSEAAAQPGLRLGHMVPQMIVGGFAK